MTGIRHYALVQTDLVDSTLIHKAMGDDAMASLWKRHDFAARELLAQWRGREMDRSDGFFLLFETPADAVGLARDYHRALATLDGRLRARVGVHFGAVNERTNPEAHVALGAKPVEVKGLAIALTTRAMSVARGGQTLLTANALALLDEAGTRFRSHGHWHMKGIGEPVEIFELVVDDDPVLPPPVSGDKVYRVVRRNDEWIPASSVRHTLPAERDSFVGRRDVLAVLEEMLRVGTRLVSVVGMGGAGKTRLAQRFGWFHLADFAGGVWFCDVSNARSLEGVARAVARDLELPLATGDPTTQIAIALANRGKCLVIVDNFEQVSQFAEQTIGTWLSRAAEAHFIVTTRATLGITGEATLALDTLGVDDAVALFVQRAQAAKREFEPNSGDRAAIERLVDLLDRLPLAIELAAARIRLMSPRMLLDRMGERFKLLTAAGRKPRHAALRSTFDWSWDLLSGAERYVLAQLSIFARGFDLELAESIVDVGEAGIWVGDVIQSLVDKSWIRSAENGRFDLLVSVHEYSGERLAQIQGGRGEPAAASAAARHWRYFAKLDDAAAVANKCANLDNLVAALRRAAAARDVGAAVGCLAHAWAALRLTGPFRLAVDLAAEVRAITGLAFSELAVVDWVTGSALHLLGDLKGARAHFDSGILEARRAADTRTEAMLRHQSGEHLSATGENEAARAELDRAVALARSIDDASLECGTLISIGALNRNLGRLDHAADYYEQALALAKKLQDARLEGGILGNLGGIEHSLGRLDRALDLYARALEHAREAGDRRWEGNTRCNLGMLLLDRKMHIEARAQFEQALGMAREMGHRRLECTVLCNLGIAVESAGDGSAARRHYEEAVTLAHALDDRRSEGQFRAYLGLAMAREGERANAEDCFAEGERMLAGVADEYSLALLLCSRAEARALRADREGAEGDLRRAQSLAETLKLDSDSEIGQALERARSAVVSGRATG